MVRKHQKPLQVYTVKLLMEDTLFPETNLVIGLAEKMKSTHTLQELMLLLMVGLFIEPALA